MKSCEKQYSPKYLNRPSPPYSASDCKEGLIKVGNDGNE